MMVLATFISICVVAVLFLLRFLIALEAEMRAERRRSTARLDCISTYRFSPGAGAYASEPVLTLIHSNAELARSAPPAFQNASLHRDRGSQLKEA